MTTKTLETVKVDDGKGGYYVLNKSEFKEGEMKLYKEPKSSAAASASSNEPEDFSKLTKAELQARLDKASITYDSAALKDDLVALADKNRDKL